MSERILRASGRRVHERRWVGAPTDSDPSAANRIVGIWLAPGESVRWEWGMRGHGQPYVCGYTIEPARGTIPRERAACGFRVGV
jgi:hypothetical protein